MGIFSMDFVTKSKELTAKITDKKSELTSQADKDQNTLCTTVVGAPEKCLGNLDGNFVYNIIAPSSIPNPSDISALIQQAKSAMSSVGCSPEESQMLLVGKNAGTVSSRMISIGGSIAMISCLWYMAYFLGR